MQEIRLFDCKSFTEVIGDITCLDNSMIETIKKQTGLFFNLRLLEADHKIGMSDKIDIIALDKDFSPVILLFHKACNESIISKGVFCIDWLLKNKEAFNELVVKTFPRAQVEKINWDNAKLLCISGEFSEYDNYMVSQINRNIRLIRCRKYPDSLLLFEVVNEQNVKFSGQLVNIDEGSRQHENLEDIKQYRPISNVYKIAWSKIENMKHYAVFANKEVVEMYDIPAAIYLAQGQFVLVDEYGRFKYVFPYKICENEINQPVSSFAVVNLKDDGIYMEKGNGELERLNNIPASIQLREKNIVAVDPQNNFMRFYKPVRHNADSFMSSVKAKGHQMAFVLKKLSEGTMLRDIEIGNEFFKSLDTGHITFEENQVICIYGNKAVSVFNSCKFYTLSTYYDRYEYGTVEIKDDLIYLKKLTGEKVIIKDAPTYLRAGQVAYVDENNNFCGIEDTGEGLEADTVKRNVNNIRTLKNLSRSNKIDITKNVLILGNKAYENSYKLCLLKYGYKTEVLEGFEPWNKVMYELKETDFVVVIISHISHDNMWRIKKEVTDIPIIYSEFDGANRILEKIIALDQEEKSVG